MFVEPHFSETDPLLQAELVRAHLFGQLIAVLPDGMPHQALLPFAWHSGPTPTAPTADWCIWGHLSRQNALANVAPGAVVRAVFAGPHGYIAPHSYSPKSVPTWNYTVVELTGTWHPHPAPAHVIAETIRQYDPQWLPQWQAMPPAAQVALLEQLVAFELRVPNTPQHVVAAFKLSQNKPAALRQTLIQSLRQSNPALAQWMDRLAP